jgi:putative transposase
MFLTLNVAGRRHALVAGPVAAILVGAWERAGSVHGWAVGRYVVMPDHVHFFAFPAIDEAKPLSTFIGMWKRSTTRCIRQHTPAFAWQSEFFDHVLRSARSYGEKIEYVRENPVRKGLVTRSEDWPYQGEITDLRW